VLEAMSQLKPNGKEATNLSVNSFFSIAEKEGHEIDEKLKARFQSKLSEALTGKKKKQDRK
jgi:hypothetical protein